MATLTAGVLGGDWSGVSGNAVFVRTARGTVVRDRVTPRDPKTPALREVRAAQGRAARAWPEMEPEAVARWTAYAAGVGLRPMNAFTNLYKVLLRLDPHAPVPSGPPARPFFGDVIAVEASGSPSSHSGERGSAEGGDAKTCGETPLSSPPRWKGSGDGARDASALSPQPPLSGAKEGEPFVAFSSSGANAPGVVTELLVQPLLSRHRRTYLEKYRHAAYVAFAAGEVVGVDTPKGWVALAYRFVNAETGQTTALAELGVVRAG